MIESGDGGSSINIIKRFKDILFREPMHFDWIQVEVTSYCNAHCIYCPRTIYKNIWSNRHLEIEVFSKILPVLKHTKLVYLQGWGEPFLNPTLFEMIKISKRQGCMVGVTSNGTLITEDTVKRLIELELDIIALSLTQSLDENDNIRKGTSSNKVLSLIDEFNTQKRLMGSVKPLVNIAYMLIGSQLKEVFMMIDMLVGRGINQIVISGLDFVVTDTLIRFADYRGYSAEACIELKDYAVNKGISLIINLATNETPNQTCLENPTRSFYLSSDGSISPCVFLNLPIKTEETYYGGQNKKYKKQIFGSITSASLDKIWYSEDYISFRKGFQSKSYIDMCSICPKLYIKTI